MNDFFEEYAWLLQSIIGGSLGVDIMITHIIDKGSLFSELLSIIIKGLM